MNTLTAYLTANPAGTLAEFNALPPVYRRVPVQEVRDLLIERRLNSRLTLARDNPALPVELRGGIIELFATLSGFEAVNATVEENRTQLIAVTAGLVEWQVVTPTDANAFTALLAEPSDQPATQEQFDAAKARTERATEGATILAAVMAYINDTLQPAIADPALPLVTPQSYFGDS